MRRADKTDIALLKDPMRWPNWPYLCMKKMGEKDPEQFGVIMAMEGRMTTIYLINFWSMVDGTDKLTEKTPKIEYKDLDALLNDGWVVD